jgi:DASH complex subunit DAD3
MEPTETTSASALTSTAEDLTPLEQDVLDEYERLAENMKKVRSRWYHEKRHMGRC